MAEEPQIPSIQQRIAALKEAQAVHTSNDSGPVLPRPQPAPKTRDKAISNTQYNGDSVNDRPSGIDQQIRLPAVKPKPKIPPPLPVRKPSEQCLSASQRHSPSEPYQVDSREPTAPRTPLPSAVGSGRTINGAAYLARELASGDMESPPLPPRRERPSSEARARNTKTTEDFEDPPALPPRRGNSNESRPPMPPRTAPRNHMRQDDRLSDESEYTSGSGSISRAREARPVPPPVPLGSRPDLSKIQETKPRTYASNGLTTAAAICLKCRNFSAADSHAARFQRQSLTSHDLRWLANELTGPFSSRTDKARVLFTWLHHNIDYDVKSFFNNSVKSSTPASTLATGLAVCEGYANLFAALARHAGLEVLVISGHGKGFGYQDLAPGSSLPRFESNHAWNVVNIDDGKWKLIDATWGAGVVQGAGQPYLRRFEPAMFTDTNDELGLRHYPSDQNQFYRDDERPSISWEEYILGSPSSPISAEQPTIFSDAQKHSIGKGTFLPATKRIPVGGPRPVSFQFRLICEHWTLERHSKMLPGLFLLMVHGIDGRRKDRIPLTHVRGSGPGGGGDFWYVDIVNTRTLGVPGQKVQIAVLTSFGDSKDARGISVQEYEENVGRVGMAWAYIAEWELV